MQTDRALLDHIRATPWIAALLTRFDFDIARAANGPVEPVHLAGGETLEMIAGDASGGDGERYRPISDAGDTYSSML